MDSRVNNIVFFDVLGAAPSWSGATEAAARERCAARQRLSKLYMTT
jgi:hypothetical protein